MVKKDYPLESNNSSDKLASSVKRYGVNLLSMNAKISSDSIYLNIPLGSTPNKHFSI